MQENLEQLLADGVIDEVLGRLKSGKEADVFLVRHRGEVVAAKVYKDRDQRNFKNNAVYKEGRQIRNSRTRRAVEKGSKFGQREAEDSWKSAEADTLYRLHAEGVRVPTPKMFYEGVLLMQLVTTADGQPAARLIDAPIPTEAARAIYLDLRRALIGMLCCDLIHGDLSPYNVLLGEAGATIIDFPQTMSAAHNNRAEHFFRRDFDNIHRFLAGIDRSLQALHGDGQEIWRAYVRRELTPDFVPSPNVGRSAFQRATLPPAQQRPSPQQVARPVHAGAGFPRPRVASSHPVVQQPVVQHRGAKRVVVPEVVYMRRPGGGGPQTADPNAHPNAEASPRIAEPQRAPRPPPPAQQHRPQHRVPHSPPIAAQPEVEVRDGSERKGPRRRRRGRRPD